MATVSEHQRRNRWAQQLGFRNYYDVRKHGGFRTVARQSGPVVSSLPPQARQKRSASLEAVSIMRREGVSLQEASQRAGVEAGAVSFWAADAFEPSGAVKPGDRLLRRLLIISDSEVTVAEVRGSRQAALVADYWNAVSRYLETGDQRHLARFRGKSVAGLVLETDPDVLEGLALEGELQFEDIYLLTG